MARQPAYIVAPAFTAEKSWGLDLFEQIILGLGGAAILVGAAAWLARSIILHFLSKDYERFKQDLATESAAEVARLKHSLELTASEHSKRISILLEHREELIAKLYQLLHSLFLAAETFAKVGAVGDQRHKENSSVALERKLSEFLELFDPNQIYFTESTATNVKELVEGIRKRVSDFREPFSAKAEAAWLGEKRRLSEADICADGALMGAWGEAAEFIRVKVPPLRLVVEREFRQLLGVSTD